MSTVSGLARTGLRGLEMNTAQNIANDPQNKIDGVAQHYRLSAAAEKQKNVRVEGRGRNRERFYFTDGSCLQVDHLSNDHDTWQANA